MKTVKGVNNGSVSNCFARVGVYLLLKTVAFPLLAAGGYLALPPGLAAGFSLIWFMGACFLFGLVHYIQKRRVTAVPEQNDAPDKLLPAESSLLL